jgi:hypothetical protein
MIREKDIFEAAKELGVTVTEETPEPGDTYLCGRNTDVQMFTCESIENGCVFPEENGYPYSTYECYKVIDMPR